MYLQASNQTAQPYYQSVPLVTNTQIAMGPSPTLRVFQGIGSAINVGAVWTNLSTGYWQYAYPLPLTWPVGAQAKEIVTTTVGGVGQPAEFGYEVGLTPLTSAQTQTAAAAAITAAEPAIGAAAVTALTGVGVPGNASVLFNVTSQASGAAIQNSLLSLQAAGQTLARGITSANGQVTLAAPNGTYTLVATAVPGFGGYSGSVTLPVPGGTVNISG